MTTTHTRTFQSEFGEDFNLGINLQGWTDESWKNDVCPCFTFKRKVSGLPEIEYRLWVDFENQKERENEDGNRYAMEYRFEDSDNWVSQFEIDEPEIVQKLISTLQVESNSISVFRTL